jgi:hypothetical protein
VLREAKEENTSSPSPVSPVEGDGDDEEMETETETEELTKMTTDTAPVPRKEGEKHVEAEKASLLTVLHVMLFTYPLRTVLGIVLMSTQAFFYNSIFFSYPLVLSRDYGVNDDAVGLYLIP